MARVLIVEDHDEIAEMMAEVLEAGGYQVAIVASANKAAEAFVLEPFDLVIMDILLRRSSGVTAALALRGLGFTGPIIAAHAGLQPVPGELYRRAGFAAELQKPFTLQDLPAIVDRLLEPPPAT